MLIAKSKQIIISQDVIFDEHSLNTHHSNLDDQNKDTENDNPNGLLTNIFKHGTASLPPPTRPYQDNLTIELPDHVGVFIDPSNQQSTISQGNFYEDTSSLSNDFNHTILEEYPKLSVLPLDHETPSTSQSEPTVTAHQQSHFKQNSRLIETIEGRKTPRPSIHQNRIIIEQTTYNKAIHGPNAHHWKETIQYELKILKNNDTWILIPLSSDQKPITCKWILKIKCKADGIIAKYKARLIARGFCQLPSVDYGETYSPVVKITSI